MKPVLENEFLRLQATDKAGEMLSLIDKESGTEMLYQGDQGWSGRNPSLFPMVGSTWKQGTYEIDGKTYAMKNHGLIRYATLQDESTPETICFAYDSDESTRVQYPYDFHYEMRYTLEGRTVKVRYAITNTGNKPMPFSFGLHPAFRTSRNDSEKFEDFSIEFFPKETAQQLIFTPQGDPVVRKEVLLDEWKLNREDLKKYATLVYDQMKATDAVLKYKDQPRLKTHFENYPTLALWSHPTPSDFVCIEPWHGHADFEDVNVPFDKREGTEILQPGETFEAGYDIEVL